MNDNTYSILLVDDHALFRGGLRVLIENHPRLKVAGEASTGLEMLDWLDKAGLRRSAPNSGAAFGALTNAASGTSGPLRPAGEFLPDVVLLDISMPGMDGIAAAQHALERYPGLRIITLSMYGEQDYYFKMVSLGVKGFLLKSSDIAEVYAAIEAVAEGGSYFSQELLTNLVGSLRTAPAHDEPLLSGRELEILLLICRGLTNAEIADNLFISKRTVDNHRANILEKTACKNTANLVVYAIKNGLVEI